MGVVLVIGREPDPCCRLVQAELARAGRAVAFLPEERLLPELRFVWWPLSEGARGEIADDGWRIAFADIDGVLARGRGVPGSLDQPGTKDGQYMSAEWEALLMAWLHWLPGLVVNRLRPALWHRATLGVPDLATLVPDLPFRLPRALVTTRADAVRAFFQTAPGGVRYSPLTEPLRYAIRSEADLARLLSLAGMLPFQITELIDGAPFEAFVVGRDVVLVGSDGALAAREGGALVERCAAVGAALGLLFYRLSLVETPEGEWYCLGLDRLPSFYGYRPEVQVEVARRLARLFLAGGRQRA